ncbi:MAG: hypothetical protein JSV38_05375 [Desulfobacterales bacterium]|nr:MAG: hypothetical protein JSV38_05375 [Desulfobacterales bacterium]
MLKESLREKENHLSWWMPTYVTLLIMGISILVMYSLDELTARSMMNDDGLVQILTAVILNMCWLFCLQRALRKIPPAFKWGQLSYLILIYAMREMDFHRLFTEENVGRWKLFTGPFPLHEKIIGGIILLVTTVVLIHFVARNFRYFWKALKAKQSWAVHAVVWAFLIFGSQALDKSIWHGDFAEVAFEENMEFGAAIMMLMVLLKYPLNWPERPAEL